MKRTTFQGEIRSDAETAASSFAITNTTAAGTAAPSEPNPAGGTFTTNYTYTPANQLTGVSMTRGNVTQTRTFLYTGSDLTSATNPENGTVTYVYDNSHHVTSRTDALGSKTVYTYDSYGRLSEVQYYPRGSNTEDTTQRVTYYYDGKFPQAYPCFGLTAPSNQYSTGRMSAVVFGGGITDAYHDSYCYQYAYTQPGRVATQQMMVAAPNTYYNSVNFAASYQWDDEGRMTSLQYPTVTATGSFGGMAANMPIAAMQYDVNGRLNAMTMDDRNGQGPQPFASASYYATGQLNTLLWGGYTETRTYNSLMQLITQSIPGVLSMTYNYSATQNNGRITGSVDSVTGENTTYSYDALNRLTNASNSLWSEAYTYDGFGNLTSKTGSGGSPNPAPTVSMTYSSKNQLTNLSYDANGNQNAWYSPYGGNTYSVENRLTLEVLQNSSPYPANIYAYDPWGKRVMSGYNPNSNSPQPTYNYTFYGVTGQKLAMLTCNGSNYPAYPTCAIVGQNVYFGKKLVVAGGATVLTDRLGSVRANGQGETSAYYPYGEERTSTVDGREKFGTYFRDTIGQDYADQRYYNAGMGRFWSPDARAGITDDPGSMNRYAYVNGDPVNFGDPRGTEEVYAGGGLWLDCGDNAESIYDGSCTGSDGGWGGDGFIAAPVPGPAGPPMTRGQWLAYLRMQLALAAASALAQNSSQGGAGAVSPALVPTFLQMASECWAPAAPQAGSMSYTLEVTYQIEDQTGAAMSGSSLADIFVSEMLYAITGSMQGHTNTTWAYGQKDGIQQNGTFTDYLSVGGLPGFVGNGSAFQTFTATGILSNGWPLTPQPLTVLGFGAPTTVLSNVYTPSNVTINGLGLGKNPATECH